MSLEIDVRRVGYIGVMNCRGRIVAGKEAEVLRDRVKAAVGDFHDVLLDLGEIEYVDSSGIGLLLNLVSWAASGHGKIRFCNLSARVKEVLALTKLTGMFETYDTEAAAIAQFHARPHPPLPTPQGNGAARVVLCVDNSCDLLSFLRGVLKGAGYNAITASNLPDARILLKAAHPDAVVVGADLAGAQGASANMLAGATANLPTFVLDPALYQKDPGELAALVIEQLQQRMAKAANPSS